MRRIKLVLAVACMAMLLVSFAAPAMAVGKHNKHGKHGFRHSKQCKKFDRFNNFHRSKRCDNFNRFNNDIDIDFDNGNIRLG